MNLRSILDRWKLENRVRDHEKRIQALENGLANVKEELQREVFDMKRRFLTFVSQVRDVVKSIVNQYRD